MKNTILVDRVNIGIFGRTNAGKSTIMNRITRQNTSIVDETRGTTTDVVRTLFEIHDFGPVRLFDTAGLDEDSELGKKKRIKTLGTLKECDLVLLVIDPRTIKYDKSLSIENEVISLCGRFEKQLMIIFNLFEGEEEKELNEMIKECMGKLFVNQKISILKINANRPEVGVDIIEFIKANYKMNEKKVELLPFIKPYSFVALNIPIDEETPEGRLLRPQNLVLDYLLRRMVPFAGYRMDLRRARCNIESVLEEERNNYLKFIRELNGYDVGLQMVITDSQAVDVVDKWTPKEIPITTFSIIMINAQSKGGLKTFVDGLRTLKTLKKGDKVIIAEACNHDRKCDDIGTRQIPRRLNKKLGFELSYEFVFGRELLNEESLKDAKLIIHCGGCMVDSQKVKSRITDALQLGIPITNYGLVLSYSESEETLRRVLKPWGIEW